MNRTNIRFSCLCGALSLGLFLPGSASAQVTPPAPPLPGAGQAPAPAPQPTPAQAVPQLLGGNVPGVIAALGLTPLGSVPPTQQINLAIALPLRDSQAFEDLVGQVYDPGSSMYRRYLTPDQVRDAFCPTEDQYEAVIGFAEEYALAVTGTHQNRLVLDVSGLATAVEAAFDVNLLVYADPNEPRTFYAPDVEPTVDVAVPISQVCGLSDYFVPRRRGGGGSGGGGLFLASDLRQAYVPGVALTGAGQVVGLYEEFFAFCRTDPSDLADYEKTNGLSGSPLINNVPCTPGQTNLVQYGGTELVGDVEMVVAAAPGVSEIIVYFGAGANAVYDILPEMQDPSQGEPLPRQISSSWDWGPYSSAGVIGTLLQMMALQGQSFLSASGDDLAYCPGTEEAAPCDSPYMTFVGGTELTITTNNPRSWSNEVVWHVACTNGAAPAGSSGGQSTNIAIPPWQQAINMTAIGGSTKFRNYPDVAAVATGIWGFHGGQTNMLSGTSFASPLWAGFTALANEQAEANGYAPVGWLNPALYAVGEGAANVYSACLHDITSGNNYHDPNCPDQNGVVTGCSGTTNGYDAFPGYDLCTGWGSPNGAAWINELIEVCDGALGCGRLNNTNSEFSFDIDFGAAAPGTNAYLLYSTNVAASSWTTIRAVRSLAGFQTYTDTSSDAQQPEGFYLLNCGTNCWRPTGYIRTVVPAGGWALVANQLDAPMNTLNQLFNPMADGTYLPNGTQLFVQNTTGSWTFNTYTWATNTTNAGSWSSGGNSVALSPGQGFWLTNPSSSTITASFAGLVRQGTLSNQVPAYEWIYSSMVPQAGRLCTDLGYIPNTNDQVYIWGVTNQSWDYYVYSAPHGGGPAAWSPSEPQLALGQSFALVPGATNVWVRTFSTCELQ